MLRLKVEKCFEVNHVERLGIMLMGNKPPSVDLVEAEGCTHPHIDLARDFSQG